MLSDNKTYSLQNNHIFKAGNFNSIMRLMKTVGVIIFSIIFLVGVLGMVSAAISSISVSSPQTGQYWRGSIPIMWNSDGSDGDHVNIYYDAGAGTIPIIAFKPYTGSYSWDTSANNISDGSHYIIYVAYSSDVGINDASGIFTIDNTKPTTINSYTLTNWQTSPVNITLTCSDASGSGCETTYYKIDSGTMQTYSSSFVISDDGSHVLEYWSVDKAGNIETHKTSSIMIDKTAPTVGITSNASSGLIVGGSANATATCSDLTSGCLESKLSISSSSIVNCSSINYSSYISSPQTITNHSYVCAASKDNAGNTGFSSPVEFKIFSTIQSAIDAANPGDTINVNAGTYVESVLVNKTVNIVGAGSTTIVDPLTDQNGFNITADGVTIQNLKITLATSGVDSQAIKIEGSDNVIIYGTTIETTGNKGVGIWIGGIGYSNSNNLNITGNTITINDESTGIYAEGGNTAQTGWIISGNIITANNGNPLELYDVSSSEVSDNTLTTTISGGSNVIWTSELANLINLIFKNNAISGSLVSQVVIGNDMKGAPLDPGNSVITSITGVTVTGNTFNNWDLRALRLGKISGTGTTTGVLVNRNNFLRSSQPQTLNNFDASQVNATFNWFGINNGTLIASLIVGNVDYTHWAYDLGSYDTQAPDTTINSPASGSWQKTNFSVSVSDSDTEARLFKCYYRVYSDVNGDGNDDVGDLTRNWTERTCNNPVTLTVGLGQDCRVEGTDRCKIQVKAVDNSGNDNWSPGLYESRKFSIDFTTPVTTDSGTDTNWHNANVTVTLTPTDVAGSGVANTYYCIDQIGTCTPSTAGTPVTVSTEGINYVRYYSVDNAGNTETAKNATNRVKIDRTAPSITNVIPGNKIISVGQTVIFNVTAMDINSVANVTIYNEGGILIGNFINIGGNSWSYTSAVYNTKGNYKYYIESEDSVGNKKREPLTGYYTITVNDMTWDLTSPLSGWNLVSAPKNLMNSSVLANEMWYYDAAETNPSSRWKHPTTINPGIGYWVNSTPTTSKGLDYSGDCNRPQCLPSGNINIDALQNSWNLIGLTSTNTTMTVGNAFKSMIYDDQHLPVYYVIRYNETSDAFEFLTGSSIMNPGEGYWVYIVK